MLAVLCTQQRGSLVSGYTSARVPTETQRSDPDCEHWCGHAWSSRVAQHLGPDVSPRAANHALGSVASPRHHVEEAASSHVDDRRGPRLVTPPTLAAERGLA